mgnify:CR=1 FL=1
MEHTPEPWIVDQDDSTMIETLGGIHVVSCQDDDDADRIVACINACAGLKSKDIEKVVRQPLASYRDLMRQRDQLLAALEELNSVSARGFLYDDPARVKARKAIASARGEE